MRDSDRQSAANNRGGFEEKADKLVPCDERLFFDSFYQANASAEDIADRDTIGVITEVESTFHYNATENSIIRALTSLQPPPPQTMVKAWRALELRQEKTHLDVGSGTGHWIDFMMSNFYVRRSLGLEIAASMASFLKEKYAGNDAVSIRCADLVDDSLDVTASGAPFDYITAIGVMFHIVDDARWESACEKLARLLKPRGLLIVGGDFGAETRNVQFHASDQFQNWKEFQTAEGVTGEVRVNKRVRSLSEWIRVTSKLGLELVNLIRTESVPVLTTPENDICVFRAKVG